MLCIVAALFLSSTCIFSADFDDVLARVAVYDFGDSRTALTELSDMLRHADDAAKLADYEKAMLNVLEAKNTPFATKQYLCKELSIMGTEASVPTLAKMLRGRDSGYCPFCFGAYSRFSGGQGPC